MIWVLTPNEGRSSGARSDAPFWRHHEGRDTAATPSTCRSKLQRPVHANRGGRRLAPTSSARERLLAAPLGMAFTAATSGTSASVRTPCPRSSRRGEAPSCPPSNRVDTQCRQGLTLGQRQRRFGSSRGGRGAHALAGTPRPDATLENPASWPVAVGSGGPPDQSSPP
jgi:hypothetical protein